MPRPFPILVTALLVGARPALADAKARQAAVEVFRREILQQASGKARELGDMDLEGRILMDQRLPKGWVTEFWPYTLGIQVQPSGKIHADAKTWSDTGL